MRLWSIHPRYLDRQGLIALWREALLAQKVLAGETRGYRHHPQLIRFREARNPLSMIGAYLRSIAQEGERRKYKFNQSKIMKPPRRKAKRIPVSRGQLAYEFDHLLKKLKVREPALFARWARGIHRKTIRPHPIFRPKAGKVHAWEKVSLRSRG